MAITDFIQTNLLIALILDELRRRSVFKQNIRTFTPADLGKAKEYVIPGLGDVTVGDYVEGTDITIQDMEDTSLTIPIDQQKYFAARYDKVTNAKAARDLAPLILDKGIYKLIQTEDAHIAAIMSAQAGISEFTSIGTLASPVVITADNVFQYLGKVKQLLDEKDVPQDGRKLGIPPFFSAALTESNVRLDQMGDPAARTTGWVGHHSGFDIYMSNNLPNVTDDHTGVSLLAWIQSAVATVDTLKEIENWDKTEKQFAELLKGLHVYGTKVITLNAVLRGVISQA
jgi:hypothetical protein